MVSSKFLGMETVTVALMQLFNVEQRLRLSVKQKESESKSNNRVGTRVSDKHFRRE